VIESGTQNHRFSGAKDPESSKPETKDRKKLTIPALQSSDRYLHLNHVAFGVNRCVIDH